jgi:inosine-uridine nucleoside N-ribohydrolase
LALPPGKQTTELSDQIETVMLTKKILLDVDPGIDDAVALCMALFDPQLEVVAVTAVGGNVQPDQATRNVQALVEQLDPPRWPRIGVASSPDLVLPSRNVLLHGSDGLGNANFQVSELQHRHASDKLIYDEIRAAPGEVTIVALGPLTNIARAFARDPSLVDMVGEIVMMGGTLDGVGNVTPAADFNIYCDPESARAVFRSAAATKTLIPIDITRQVTFGFDLLDRLPANTSRVGRVLSKIVPHLFRSYRQELGFESICLNDCVALVAALHPELFEIELTAVDVELSGELTRGATVFDRRRNREWRTNVAVATKVDVPAVQDCILRGLAAAGTASRS